MQLLDQFFLSFGTLTIVALFGAFLSNRWRQPTVVGLLIAGMVLGPHALGVVSDNDFIQLFAEFGAAMLLFSIGVEFSLSKILGSGMRSLLVASVILGGLFLTGYEIGVILGLDYLPSLALAACLSFSSTTIFVRLMQQYKLMDEPQVPLLISVLVIEDIVAVAFMAFFSSLGAETSQSGHVPLFDLLLSVLFSLAVMGVAYLVLRALFKRLRHHIISFKSEENLILLSMGLCVLFALLASSIGLSPSIGAFLAGSTMAGLSIRDEVERLVAPFSLAFSSFFFISIGLLISPAVLAVQWPVVLLVSAGFMLASFALVAPAIFLSGYSARQAVMSAAAMMVVGEFSLLMARQADPLVSGFALFTILSASMMITTVVSSLLLSRVDAVAASIRVACSRSGRSRLCRLRDYTVSVLAEFEQEGDLRSRARSTFAALRRHLTLFAIVGLGLWLSRRWLGTNALQISGYSMHQSTLVLALAVMVMVPALLDVLGELRLLGGAVSAAFIRNRFGEERAARRMAFDFLLLTGLALLVLVHPLAVDLLMLPNIVHWSIIIPILAMVLVVCDMLSMLRLLVVNKSGSEGAEDR